MTSPILIIAIGNESRGDDALGPLLLRQLKAQINPQQIELLEDFQLQIEHAADLLDRELVLFVDAGLDTPAPYSFYRAKPDTGRTLFSHALAPEAVLATYMQVYQEEPPPSFVLCISGNQFELGAPVSPQAESHLQAARNFVQAMLHDADADTWHARVTAS
jgi:hydrogenase maturation protease